MSGTLSHGPRDGLQSFERAQAALALRTSFEDTIADSQSADAAAATAFWRYSRFELSQPPPHGGAARACAVLERAVARFPATIALWEELAWLTEAPPVATGASAASTDAKSSSAGAHGDAEAAANVSQRVYERAVANCPWCGRFILTGERMNVKQLCCLCACCISQCGHCS